MRPLAVPVRLMTGAVVAAMLAAVAACGSSNNNTTQPSPSVLVDPLINAVPATASSGLTANVTVANVTSWTAASDQTFVTITAGASGTTNGSVTYSVAANTSSTARSAHITVTGTGSGGTAVGSLTVNQAAASST